MKIKRVWIECETDAGETILKPATDDDLEYFRYKPNPGAMKQPGHLPSLALSLVADNSLTDPGFPTWEPGPGYTREEIEAMRLKPEELREAVKG